MDPGRAPPPWGFGRMYPAGGRGFLYFCEAQKNFWDSELTLQKWVPRHPPPPRRWGMGLHPPFPSRVLKNLWPRADVRPRRMHTASTRLPSPQTRGRGHPAPSPGLPPVSFSGLELGTLDVSALWDGFARLPSSSHRAVSRFAWADCF